MTFNRGSRAKLTPYALHLFQEDTLFHRVARVLCHADCLPRKELFEAWEVARRARRRFRGGRIVDLACGHGLLAHLMLLLDDTSETAIAVDRRLPASAAKISDAMVKEWPRLAGRVTLTQVALAEVETDKGDVVVSAHACGSLTDEVITSALKGVGGQARIAVLPCCHEKATGDRGGLGGWLDDALAMDVTRAARLRAAGYRVWTQRIPEAITPKNRLLLGSVTDEP